MRMFTTAAASSSIAAMKRLNLTALTIAVSLLFGVTACKDKTTAEKVEDSVANAADSAKDATQDAVDATKDAFNEVGKELTKVGEDIKDGAVKAYEDTKKAVTEAVKK